MRIAIFGAGSIGCLIGGSLIARGNEIVLVGREEVGRQIAEHGLTVSDLDGRSEKIPAEMVNYSLDTSAIANSDVILLTVKCTDTGGSPRNCQIRQTGCGHLQPAERGGQYRHFA